MKKLFVLMLSTMVALSLAVLGCQKAEAPHPTETAAPASAPAPEKKEAPAKETPAKGKKRPTAGY